MSSLERTAMEEIQRDVTDTDQSPAAASPKVKQPELLALLKRWMAEYGDRKDPKLEEDLHELEAHPVRINEQ
jgi:hypothetical protein